MLCVETHHRVFLSFASQLDINSRSSTPVAAAASTCFVYLVYVTCSCCCDRGSVGGQVEMLLKHGAYDVFKEGKEGEEAGKKFCEDDIESILSRAKVCIYLLL